MPKKWLPGGRRTTHIKNRWPHDAGHPGRILVHHAPARQVVPSGRYASSFNRASCSLSDSDADHAPYHWLALSGLRRGWLLHQQIIASHSDCRIERDSTLCPIQSSRSSEPCFPLWQVSFHQKIPSLWFPGNPAPYDAIAAYQKQPIQMRMSPGAAYSERNLIPNCHPASLETHNHLASAPCHPEKRPMSQFCP